MNGLLIYVIIVICIVVIAVLASLNAVKKKDPSPIVEKDHRWHSSRGEYAEDHEDRIDMQLLKHPEPETGYVVLNGIKRKIEDCKNL